jgi:hypothetical protein
MNGSFVSDRLASTISDNAHTPNTILPLIALSLLYKDNPLYHILRRFVKRWHKLTSKGQVKPA